MEFLELSMNRMNSWKFMGNSWEIHVKYMESSWKFMGIHGKSWEFTESSCKVHGKFMESPWKFMEIHGIHGNGFRVSSWKWTEISRFFPRYPTRSQLHSWCHHRGSFQAELGPIPTTLVTSLTVLGWASLTWPDSRSAPQAKSWNSIIPGIRLSPPEALTHG